MGTPPGTITGGPPGRATGVAVADAGAHISGDGSQFLKPETGKQKLHSTLYCTTNTICCVRVADPDVAVTVRL